MSNTIVVIKKEAARVISEVKQGPAGRDGDTLGLVGFIFTQVNPETIWDITHNLNRIPVVTVVNSFNDQIEPSVTFPTLNRCVITHAGPTSGTASLV